MSLKRFAFNASALAAGALGAGYLLYAMAVYLHGGCIGVCP